MHNDRKSGNTPEFASDRDKNINKGHIQLNLKKKLKDRQTITGVAKGNGKSICHRIRRTKAKWNF